MARYTGPSCKLCRREGKKLFLKGDKCLSGKCAFEHRSTAPGQHGAARKKMSGYATQLREKQTARRYYYYAMAEKKEGMTGENLLSILESRLDNVVFRMGLANSRKEARQMVLHGHFTLNGHRADIPSILVKAGDVVALKEGSKDLSKFKALAETAQTAIIPKWLDMDKANLTAKVLNAPQREDIDFPFDEQLIVELYSK